MGFGLKKIAVNVTEDYDLESIHNDVVNFLYNKKEDYELDVVQGTIQIDYYICHENITDPFEKPWLKNSTVRASKLFNEDVLFEKMHNGVNDLVMEKVKPLFKKMYRSQINSHLMVKRIPFDFYEMVITYDRSLSNFKMKTGNFVIEQDYFFIQQTEQRFMKVEYGSFVCAMSTFLKTVNFWQFTGMLSDKTFKIWDWFNKIPDCEKFILPQWLNMQSIRIRDLNVL